MDEDPSNEAYVLSLLKGYGWTRPKPWISRWPLTWRTGGANTLLRTIEGSYPRIGPRQSASPGRPNRSPWSTASCISTLRLESCSDASPSPRAGSSSGTSTQAYAAIMRDRAPSWATRFTKASMVPQRSPTPTRSYAPARGGNSTQDPPPSSHPPDHTCHMAVRRVGIGHRWAPAECARGLQTPVGRRGQVFKLDRGTPHH
jgi:hypothetical protein